jgi:hypothetical protein
MITSPTYRSGDYLYVQGAWVYMPFNQTPKPLTPQLYEAIDAKLARISEYTAMEYYAYLTIAPIKEACAAIKRCRQDLKYEYLGLKDSWL